jgi:hypothetical protein
MSYTRVIPRDLFNEANLLKCYGHIYIELEKLPADSRAELVENFGQGEPFKIEQDVNGCLSIGNVALIVHGDRCWLSRPLNSRDAWPLWIEGTDSQGELDEPFEVFDSEGHFSPDMLAFIAGQD